MKKLSMLLLVVAGMILPQFVKAQGCDDPLSWCNIYVECYRFGSGVWGNGASVEVWQDTMLRGVAMQTTDGGHDTVVVGICPDLPVQLRWRADSILMVYAPNSNMTYRYRVLNAFGQVLVDNLRGIPADDTLVCTINAPCFACFTPEHLQVDSVFPSNALVTWEGPAAAIFWPYRLTNLTTGEVEVDNAPSSRLNFTTLTPNCDYHLTVYASCGSDQSDSVSVDFSTPGWPITVLPYTTGFETTQDRAWSFANGANGWVVGAAGAKDGAGALYISNDGGASNAYSNTPSLSWAWRDVDLTYEGHYELEFDWRCRGENLGGAYDYGRVFLAPADAVFEAGYVPGQETWPSYAQSTYFNFYTPTGWLDLGAATPLVAQASWQHFSGGFDLDSSQVGMWKLCFAWTNDNSTTNNPAFGNPPLSVDNLRLNHYCADPPSGLVLDSVSALGDAYLHWTGSQTANGYAVEVDGELYSVENENYCTVSGLRAGGYYEVTVASVCGEGERSERDSLLVVMPCDEPTPTRYIEDFSHSRADQPATPCWDIRGWVSVYADEALPEDRVIVFHNAQSMVVMQQFDTSVSGLDVMFRAGKYAIDGEVIVGVATEVNDSVVAMDTVAVLPVEGRREMGYESFRDYTVALAGYVGSGERIVLASDGGVMLEEVVVDRTAACRRPSGLRVSEVDSTTATLVWICAEEGLTYIITYTDEATGEEGMAMVNDSTVQLTGLEGNHTYTVRVSTVCDNGFEVYPIRCRLTTDCSPVALPFVESFDASSSLPACWQAEARDGYSQAPRVDLSDDGYGVLYFPGSGAVVLPEMSESLGALQLEFDYSCRLLVGSNMIVGVMEDTLFVPIDTIVPLGNHQVSHHEVYFNNYTGSSRIIALRSDGGYFMSEVDNVEVKYLSGCLPVQHVRVVGADEISLTVDWDSPSLSATEWEVSVVGDTTFSSYFTSHPATVMGLTSGEEYLVRVRALCGGDSAVWSAAVTGLTSCGTWYVEWADTLFSDFEEGTQCWTVVSPTNFSAASNQVVHYTSHSGSQSVNVTSREEYLFSPHFEGSDSLLLYFYYYGENNSELQIGYAAEMDWESVVWVDSLQPLTRQAGSRVWASYAKLLPAEARYVVFHKTNDIRFLIDDVWVKRNDGSFMECDTVAIESFSVEASGVLLTWNAAGGTYYVSSSFGDWDDDEEGIATDDTTMMLYAWNHYGDTMTCGVRQLCPNGEYSDWSTVRVEMVDVACQAPLDFSLDAMNSVSASFVWDTLEGPAECQLKLLTADAEVVFPESSIPYTLNNLTPGTQYRALWRAMCGEHHPGPWSSDTLRFTTPGCQTVTGLTAVRNASDAVVLNWQPAPDGIGQWVVYFRRADRPNDEFTEIMTATRPLSVVNLERNVGWEFHVASYCTQESLSEMSQALMFNDEEVGVEPIVVESSELRVYPNPTSGMVHMAMEGLSDRTQLLIYDLSGRLLMQMPSVEVSNDIELDLSLLPSGHYLIKAVTPNEAVVRRIVVLRP